MIQFNLLPDVKLAYIRTHQTKRLVTLVAISVTALAVGLTMLLFVVVNVLQKRTLSNLDKDIKKYSADLKNTPDVNKVLTIQNQLNSLPGLHEKKVVATRLFDYLTKLTPIQASIADFDIDFTTNTISFNGRADNLSVVNKFADTLKFTTYTVKDSNQSSKAFSEVVLSNFSRADKTQYQLDAKFDPTIFDVNTEVELSVPNIISTRSATEKPSELFQQLEGAQ